MTAALPTKQVPGVQHRRFGDVFVTALSDGYVDLPAQYYLNADAALAATLQAEAFLPPQPRTSINAYLVRTSGRTVLIDTGTGGTMAPTAGSLMDNLAVAGVAPDEVDVVLMTHMHVDHFGSAALPDGRPAFPNADLMLSRAEADFWLEEGKLASAPEQIRATMENAQRVAKAYEGRVHTLDAAALPAGIAAHPLPGHTPGHTGYMIGAGADRLLIWGDVFHLPALQVRQPEIGLAFDVDPAQAQQTRRDALALAADERLMVAGMHMDFPGFAHIGRTASGYSLAWSAWAPIL